MYREKHSWRAKSTSVWYGLAFIVNKNEKYKIKKLGKPDSRIPILKLTGSKSKKQKRNRNSKKMVLNQAQDYTVK